jgi:hypothetical protein
MALSRDQRAATAAIGRSGLIVTTAQVIMALALTFVGLALGPIQEGTDIEIIRLAFRFTTVWLALISLIVYPIVDRIQARRAAAALTTESDSSDIARMAQARLRTGIIGLAIPESTTLLGAVVYLLIADPVSLAVGWASLIVALAWSAPLPGRILNWVENRLEDAQAGY